MIDYFKKASLAKKVAFVAGGAGLIGAEVSKALASAGAFVVILDIDKKKSKNIIDEINENGYNAVYEYFDITDIENMIRNMNKFVKKYKSMDVWVNVSYPRTKDWGGPFDQLTLRSLRKNVDMHLNSYTWASRQAALIMKKNKIKGAIINFGSTYGVLGNDFTVYEKTNITGSMPYSAIKGGIINLSRFLASYFGKHGIRVNNICPGGIFDNQNKVFVRNYQKKTPLKRMGRPDEIASAVLFLASDAASYITGSTIMVDGGWSII